MTHEKLNLRGVTEAIISAIAFGTIPLFSMPVIKEGMNSLSLLVYRFAFGCLVILGVLLFNKRSITISKGDALRIFSLSLLYTVSAIALLEGYLYISSGVATTLLFSYPVWTALIMALFFKERLKIGGILSIGLALVGVVFLSGILSDASLTSYKGVLFELLSGLMYAIYMVVFPVMKIRHMSSLKLTFYIFFFTMINIWVYSLFTSSGLEAIPSFTSGINLVLLGLVPTAISNITLVMALKKISSTMTAVLGAFEPVTAMLVGVLVFNEPFTSSIALGLVLILFSVIFLILSSGSKKKPSSMKQGSH